MSHSHNLNQYNPESISWSILKKKGTQTERYPVLLCLESWLFVNICQWLSVRSLHHNLYTFMQSQCMFCTLDCILHSYWQQNRQLWSTHLYKLHIVQAQNKLSNFDCKRNKYRLKDKNLLYILCKKLSFY